MLGRCLSLLLYLQTIRFDGFRWDFIHPRGKGRCHNGLPCDSHWLPVIAHIRLDVRHWYWPTRLSVELPPTTYQALVRPHDPV